MPAACGRACLKNVAAGVPPAEEGGILPPGPDIRISEGYQFCLAPLCCVAGPPGWKPGSTSAKMADATFPDMFPADIEAADTLESEARAQLPLPA